MKSEMRRKMQINQKILAVILNAFLLAQLCPGVSAACSDRNNQARPYLRLHIVAHSDSREDQALKLKVRDYVLEQLAPCLLAARDYSQARENVGESLAALKSGLSDFLEEEGKACRVSLSILQEEFPATAYKNFSLPAGQYEALRITLGEGKGQNWWCVLYPTLCLRDTENFAALPVMTSSGKDGKSLWQNIKDRCRSELVRVWLTQ